MVDSLDIHINEVMRIINTIPDDQLRSTHCLQYIDNYGDTVFNMLQKEKLALELKSLIGGYPADQKDLHARMIDILDRYKDEVHLYVKFYGD